MAVAVGQWHRGCHGYVVQRGDTIIMINVNIIITKGNNLLNALPVANTEQSYRTGGAFLTQTMSIDAKNTCFINTYRHTCMTA